VSSGVLDASAVLALFHREPGWESVAASLEGAAISAVNLAEVATRMLERGLLNERVREDLAALRLEIAPFDETLAFEAAGLRSATKHACLSLGDRACLATAKRLGVRAITADRQWSRLRVGVQVQVIR
jgi:PIN domain nuclease of toxin-antitoxin system